MENMDIVVVGSCNIDLISYVPRLPKPGETLHGNKFSIGFGGKGANQCVAAAKLGARVAMVAKLGTDVFGNDYLKNLVELGVNTGHVLQTDKASTGVAPICVDESGQNSIVIVSGANMLLTPDDVMCAEAIIKSAKVVICQLEIDPVTTLAALKLARRHGVRTILNPAPAQSLLDPEMYKNSDIFCPNETEAELLTGLSVRSVSDAEKALGMLLDRGCGQVVITMGKQGSVYATQLNRTPVHVPADVVVTVDSTGAGDAFIGSLGYFLSNGGNLDLGECIRRAGKIATISVQAPGTQTSFPNRHSVPQDILN